jgi:hypothetical protein
MQNRVPRNKIAHAPQSTLRGLLEILSVSSMIPKNGNRFSEKIMLKQKDKRRVWFNADSGELRGLNARVEKSGRDRP